MLRYVLVICLTLLLQPTLAQTPFPSTNDEIPPDWDGQVFLPNFEFPELRPVMEPIPWEDIDFREQPRQYMAEVLAYVLEGMDRTTWNGRSNPVRQWYHAPWMHEGFNGREFIHGLTRERSSRRGELGAKQSRCYQNWAVSIANPLGAYTFGRVWGDGSELPDPTKGLFEPGAVLAKLLFTQAPASEVPLLAGAPEWQANIHDPEELYDGCPSNRGRRFPQTVRLLQFDIAVRHSVAETSTGWVYGTFVFDGRRPGSDPWSKLAPVGLMWGNDPELSDADAVDGVEPQQSVVLSDFGLGREFGRGGRMNGPVDNPESACLSCHMTAQYPSVAGVIPRGDAEDVLCWFRNLAPSEAFGYGPSDDRICGEIPDGRVAPQDTSLQLAIGLRNYATAAATRLPITPEQPPIEPLSPTVRSDATATLDIWHTQSKFDRAAVLNGAAADRGIVTVPPHRGDPDLVELPQTPMAPKNIR